MATGLAWMRDTGSERGLSGFGLGLVEKDALFQINSPGLRMHRCPSMSQAKPGNSPPLGGVRSPSNDARHRPACGLACICLLKPVHHWLVTFGVALSSSHPFPLDAGLSGTRPRPA